MPPNQLPAAAQAKLGLPDGFRTYSPFPFGGVNLQSSPIAIADQEFSYMENFLRLGDGYLRTTWDVGPPLFTAFDPVNNPIVSFFFFTIATTYYVAVFLKDGSALQVDMAGHAIGIGPAGTFYNSANGQLPRCSQWGTLYLLISNRNTQNDYWAWDGSDLLQVRRRGTSGVNLLSGGSNYTSVPTMTPFGGHGSGIVLSGSVNAGSLVDVEIVNPGSGYTVGDTVQIRFSGGGSDNSAQLTAHLLVGGVTSVQITNPGSGYTFASVAFTGGGGSGGAAGTVQISGTGTVIGVTITAHGSYGSAPAVVITGDGSSAAGAAFLSSTGVDVISVDHGGSGFFQAPILSLVGGGGAGATAVATLVATSIAAVNVTAVGQGYTSVPTVVFSSTSGSGAVAHAFVTNGQVISIVLTNAGSGYTAQPFISFTGGGGSGAAAQAVLVDTSIGGVTVQNAGQTLHQRAGGGDSARLERRRLRHDQPLAVRRKRSRRSRPSSSGCGWPIRRRLSSAPSRRAATSCGARPSR